MIVATDICAPAVSPTEVLNGQQTLLEVIRHLLTTHHKANGHALWKSACYVLPRHYSVHQPRSRPKIALVNHGGSCYVLMQASPSEQK